MRLSRLLFRHSEFSRL